MSSRCCRSYGQPCNWEESTIAAYQRCSNGSQLSVCFVGANTYVVCCRPRRVVCDGPGRIWLRPGRKKPSDTHGPQTECGHQRVPQQNHDWATGACKGDATEQVCDKTYLKTNEAGPGSGRELWRMHTGHENILAKLAGPRQRPNVPRQPETEAAGPGSEAH